MSTSNITEYPIDFDLRFLNHQIRELLSLPEALDCIAKHKQISFLNRSSNHSFEDGVGSLWDYTNERFWASTNEFKYWHPSTPHTFIEMYETTKKFALNIGLGLGRCRLMRLEPCTTLSLHSDPEDPMRFHVPIRTNNKCVFISVPGPLQLAVLGTMPTIGRLYSLNDTQAPHSAINMAKRLVPDSPTWRLSETENFRDHLVIDTYKL